MSYNGWTNYATWRINLEIFDGLTAEELTGEKLPAVSELKDAIKEFAEQLIEDTTLEGIGRDYAFAFISDVDWWDIANHMISDAMAEES